MGNEYAISGSQRFIFVANEDDSEYLLIDLKDGRRKTFEKISFQWGGQRLAIDDRGNRFFAATYHSGGVSAYDLTTGEIIWQRRDLRKTQKLVINQHLGLLYCTVESKPARILNQNDGKERTPIRGLKDFYFAIDSPMAVLQFAKTNIVNQATGLSLEIESEAAIILDALFFPDFVLVVWFGGILIKYDSATGQKL